MDLRELPGPTSAGLEIKHAPAKLKSLWIDFPTLLSFKALFLHCVYLDIFKQITAH